MSDFKLTETTRFKFNPVGRGYGMFEVSVFDGDELVCEFEEQYVSELDAARMVKRMLHPMRARFRYMTHDAADRWEYLIHGEWENEWRDGELRSTCMIALEQMSSCAPFTHMRHRLGRLKTIDNVMEILSLDSELREAADWYKQMRARQAEREGK